MLYTSMVFCIVMVFIGKMTEKKLVNPISVFYAVWFMVCYLASLKLYGINSTTEKTFSMIFIGFVFFSLGYYICRLFCKNHQYTLKGKNFTFGITVRDKYELKTQIILFMCFFSLLIYLIDFTKTFSYLIGGNSLAYIRKLAQDGSSLLNNQSTILVAIKTLLVSPFVMILQPVVSYDFWLGRKDKRMLCFNITLLVLKMFTDGSRSNLIYFLFHFVLGYMFVYGKNFKQMDIKNIWSRKKSRRIMLICGVVGVCVILWATLSRSGENVRKFAYYYFAMEPYMFERWADIVDKSNLVGHGVASTHGFSFAILYVLKNLRIISSYPDFWQSISSTIASTQTEWMIITSLSNRANAYVSLFWYFYLDGRVWGIVIGMFTYGIIAANTFWTAIKNTSPRTLCMYAFIVQGLLMSFVRFQFSNITYAISFAMIFFLYKRKRREPEI